jgi:hypothetical protein
MAHFEPVHVGVALASVHAMPHAPQLLALLVVSTSQPSTAAPLQSANPVAHVPTAQAELAHFAVAWGTAHAWPQDAQLFASLVVSTQVVPLHSVGAVPGHPDTHEYIPEDARHTGVPPLHAEPVHAPQCAARVRLVSQPFEATPSQSAYPARQDPMAQAPPLHVALALASAQTWPHPPQLFTSAAVCTSHPVDAS